MMGPISNNNLSIPFIYIFRLFFDVFKVCNFQLAKLLKSKSVIKSCEFFYDYIIIKESEVLSASFCDYIII